MRRRLQLLKNFWVYFFSDYLYFGIGMLPFELTATFEIQIFFCFFDGVRTFCFLLVRGQFFQLGRFKQLLEQFLGVLHERIKVHLHSFNNFKSTTQKAPIETKFVRKNSFRFVEKQRNSWFSLPRIIFTNNFLDLPI